MPAAQYVKEPCEIRRYFPADYEADYFIPREVGGNPKYRDYNCQPARCRLKLKRFAKSQVAIRI
jgi:hypothetical protein